MAWRHELDLRGAGHTCIAGVDEVGRGPLAGPVVAAAVVMGEDVREELLAKANDSKAVAKGRRETLAEFIRAHCRVAVAEASVVEIDTLNIYHATLLAMRRAVEQLQGCDAVLLDGNARIRDFRLTQKTVVGGDACEVSIACASLVAKVHRDGLMAKLAAEFPGYGWESNAGYGTAAHMHGLVKQGVTVHHRKSFAPVRALLEVRDAA